MKKNLTTKRDASKPKIILKQQSSKQAAIVKDSNNFLLSEDYFKNFINFDVKIQTEEKIQPVKINKDKTLTETKEDKTTSHITSINKLFCQTEIKIKKLEEEFLKLNSEKNEKKSDIATRITLNFTNIYNMSNEEINFLKSKLINLKMKLEIEKTKSKFYELIFYNAKNFLEKFRIADDQNLQSKKQNVSKDENEKILKKLEDIFTQNNKFYYETFNNHYRMEHEADKFEKFSNSEKTSFDYSNFIAIENQLKNLMNKMTNFLSHSQQERAFETNSQNFVNIRDEISVTLKKILSLYMLKDDLTSEFSQRSKFILENSQKFVNFEIKERKEKILNEFEKFLNQNMNKVVNNKIKNEILLKILNLNSFHENFYAITRVENLNIKNNSDVYVNNVNIKNSNIKKIIESFLNYSECSFDKLKELIELSSSKNIKHLDKVTFSFLSKEEKGFLDLIEKFEELKKSYHLIK